MLRCAAEKHRHKRRHLCPAASTHRFRSDYQPECDDHTHCRHHLDLNEGVTLENQGRLIALGKESQPVRVTSPINTKRFVDKWFLGVSLHRFSHGVDLVTVENTEDIPQRFEHCSFEHCRTALRL